VLIVVIMGWVGHAGAQATPPALPAVFLSTPYIARTGATIDVPRGGDLQAAFNTANPGDRIRLAAGAVFSGNFTLPVKAASTSPAGDIYVETSGLSGLPEGVRASPSQAASMATIVSPNTQSALAFTANSSHWRFVGIEITTTWSVTVTGTNFN